MPRVALVVRVPEVPAVERLCAAVAAEGAEAVVLRPGQVEQVLGWARPKALLARLGSGTPPDMLANLAALQLGPWVDGPATLAGVHDKALCLSRLAAAGLPVPPTALVLRDGPVDLTDLPGDRFVVKPVIGQGGRGVVLGLTRQEAGLRAAAFADLVGRALVQPFLGAGADRRVLIVDDQLVVGVQRVPAARDGRANISAGAVAQPWEPSAEHVQLARAAARALGLNVAGVDLMDHGGQVLILEVNACPGFTSTEASTGADVAGALARAAIRRARAV